jgi:LPS sulfotransferase NodH
MNMHLAHPHARPEKGTSDLLSRASAAAPGGLDTLEQTPPVPHVAIACTLRSGSNLLCEMLRINGFGMPKEWFQINGSHLAGAVGTVNAMNIRLLQSQTEHFLQGHEFAQWRGVKWDWRQFQRVRKLAPAMPEAASVLKKFQAGKWFLLQRRDLAAQAVSFYAARQTNVWMGEDITDYRRLRKDFDAIYERFAELSADIFAWESHLSASGYVPMRVWYEDLVSGDPQIWLRVMQHLDPGFGLERLNLEPLQARPREHARVRELKCWFREQLMAGRQPRSVLWLLEEIGRTVARVEGHIPMDGLVGRLTADLAGSPDAFRVQKLDLRKDLERTGAASLVQGSQFTDRVSLRLDPPAACTFRLSGATRILLQFHAHSWSGIAEVALGGRTEEIDLFTTRTDTRHVFYEFPEGFTGTIAVRCTGRKNMLSKGAEIWLHRALVLSGS